MSEKQGKDAGAMDDDAAVLRGMTQFVRESAEKLPEPARSQTLEVIDFRTSLTIETDRGAALMAAAFMDDKLKHALAGRLVDNRKLVTKALEFNGALGTFSSRIDFAFLLGLIPKNAHKDLHTIRKIRNAFAHDAKPMSFDDDSIGKLCETLSFHGVKPAAAPASKFRRSVMGLLSFINEVISSGKHIEPVEDYEIPDRSEAYKIFSATYEKFTGKEYPLKHEHE